MNAVDCRIRRASALDLDRGLRDVLGQLSPMEESDETPMFQVCRAWKVVFAAEIDDRVVGTASVLIETKLTRGTSRVAHVEDVVVDETCRGTGVGSRLLEHVAEFARGLGCYKVVLSCSESVAPFYEANGFHRHEVQMRMDLPES